MTEPIAIVGREKHHPEQCEMLYLGGQGGMDIVGSDTNKLVEVETE